MRAVEVHLSNLYKREPFRHASVTGGACEGVITGLGFAGYRLAVTHLATPAAA
jgi:3-dehydroquinate dehydratase-2